MSLKDKIVEDLTAAMKAKDANRLSVLRMVKANLMNRQIEKGAPLTDEEVTKARPAIARQAATRFGRAIRKSRTKRTRRAGNIGNRRHRKLPAASGFKRRNRTRRRRGNRRNRRHINKRNGRGNESRASPTRRQDRRRQISQRNGQGETAKSISRVIRHNLLCRITF
jgi:hypothetical protein